MFSLLWNCSPMCLTGMFIQNATMGTLVQIVLNRATWLVEAATKRVVYVTRDVNPVGEVFIVKKVCFYHHRLYKQEGIFSYLYPSCRHNLRNSKLPCFHSFNFYNKMKKVEIYHRFKTWIFCFLNLCASTFLPSFLFFFLYNPILFSEL